jgi:hypothetical protein
MDPKCLLIFTLASVVAELLAILGFFTNQKLLNMSGTNAATWWHKLAADFPSLALITRINYGCKKIRTGPRFSYDIKLKLEC